MCKDWSKALDIVKVMNDNYLLNIADIKKDVWDIFKKLDTIANSIIIANDKQSKTFNGKIKEIKEDIKWKVDKDDFAPIKNLVYWAIWCICTMFLVSVWGLVFVTITK